tara:strand:+ start:970 stop:1194 length:225 start_codon:yes stop_codon:yes gene_type:complete
MPKIAIDRYVKVTRRFDSSKKPYFEVTLFSENPDELPRFRTHKQFPLGYETGSKTQADLYAYKLAKCLECRVVV